MKIRNTTTGDRQRIALVDDDPDFRAILRGWLHSRYDKIEELLASARAEVPD